MREQRGIIDTHTLRFYMPGPGDYNLEAALPPGTDCIQCELSPSGHRIMPRCDWDVLERQESQGGLQLEREITLNANQQAPPQTPLKHHNPHSNKLSNVSRCGLRCDTMQGGCGAQCDENRYHTGPCRCCKCKGSSGSGSSPQ